MAGANLHLRHSLSTAQFVPTFSSPSPPPHRVQLRISPSRVLFSNLRANSPTSRTTTRRSNTVASSSVSSAVDSDSLVGDGGEVRKIPLLEVKDLRAVIVESRQEILKGVNLVVYEGEVHAVMGKNGSGKSTFSKVLVGHPDYEVTGGSIVFKGQNLVDMEPEERSLAGLFMSFQSPVEIPGVSNMDFLNMAFNARKRKLGQPELDPIQFYSHLVSKLEVVNMKTDFLNRNVNEGFSGGERKRNEILQLAVLLQFPPCFISCCKDCIYDKKTKCSNRRKETNGGVSRLKHHLIGDSTSVIRCPTCPEHVRIEWRDYAIKKAEERAAKTMRYEPVLNDIDGEDVEGEPKQKANSNKRKKRGPLDRLYEIARALRIDDDLYLTAVLAVKTHTNLSLDILENSISLLFFIAIHGKRIGDQGALNAICLVMVSSWSLQVLGAELAILDEIDSGLDVDALQDVAKAVNGLLTPKNSVLMITHYQRLLDYIKPTFIHIMENGRIIKTGDNSLAKLLEKEGYKAISG
ncbi:hypothetical protein DY000_02003898 [Brassica cretica]|uniref:ABC transporter domain-containing protein n=1 Tax=Brassica cretica TaxID=69181 RepID=A0ABQ7C7Z7_BRACR|nr:hypothetical protein DY000_02003898 [Brassica cretica]